MYKKSDNIFIKCQNYYVMRVQYKDVWYDFFIDEDDYGRVKQRHWRTSHKKNKVYALSGSRSKFNIVYLHNYVLQRDHCDGLEVDHINGNELDNRKSNLRVCTRIENIHNTRAKTSNKIGIRGITYEENWHSYVVDFSYNKTRFYFPHWKTIEEAVYCRMYAEEYFGISVLSRNGIAQKYLKLPKETSDLIKETVLQNIAKATVQKS